MASIEQIKQLALGIARSLSTEQIMEAFKLTDVQLEEKPDNDRRIDLIEARGWMMEVLEERQQLWRVMGITVDTRVSYEDMANPRREGWISGEVAGMWAIRWDEGEYVYNLHEVDGVRFHETVSKDMLLRGAERSGTGGWNVIS